MVPPKKRLHSILLQHWPNWPNHTFLDKIRSYIAICCMQHAIAGRVAVAPACCFTFLWKSREPKSETIFCCQKRICYKISCQKSCHLFSIFLLVYLLANFWPIFLRTKLKWKENIWRTPAHALPSGHDHLCKKQTEKNKKITEMEITEI